jgi:hypothetical protein
MLWSTDKSTVVVRTHNAARALALFLFGVSFGYVEAAVVVYLRPYYEPLHQRFHAGHVSGQLFPLVTLEQLDAAGPDARQRLTTEVGREAATLVMLAAAALAIARNFRQWFAGFLIAFGVWDIFYYVFLKVLLDWPSSLFEWDLLFLLPVPWAGPVLAPVIVALSMVCCGAILLVREERGRPVCPRALDWTAIVSGGLLIVAAFCWDCRNLMRGGEPNPFNWLLFLCGEALGLTGFVHACWSSQHGPGYGAKQTVVSSQSSV